jgi:hypothetical protein
MEVCHVEAVDVPGVGPGVLGRGKGHLEEDGANAVEVKEDAEEGADGEEAAAAEAGHVCAW